MNQHIHPGCSHQGGIHGCRDDIKRRVSELLSELGVEVVNLPR